MNRYRAPWSPLLIVLSSLQTAVCVGLALVFFKRGGSGSFGIGMLVLVLVLGCLLFTIRGYTITGHAILIHRLFWATRLSLAGLQSAQVERVNPWQGIRIGNGGFFSFTGFRYDRRLGFYRAFVTDHRRTIVLHYPKRIVVLSPAAPERFIQDIRGAATT